MGLPEVDPAVGIAALRDVARRGASVAATRANRAMIHKEQGKQAEDLRRPSAGDAGRLTSQLLLGAGENVLDHLFQNGQIAGRQ